MKRLDKIKIEGKFGHGAIPLNPIHRKIRQWKRKQHDTVKGLPFNWSVGYDIRNTIGSISIKDQGTNDSCSGQAGSYFLEIQRRIQNIKEGAISARSMYAPIAYPGGGTTVSSLENQIEAHGANLEATVPSQDVNGIPLPESVISNDSFETSALIKDALTRAGYTIINVTCDMESVAQAIQQYGAVIWEIHGQNGHTPGWLSPTPQPPVPDNGSPIFAHFMCAIGAQIINGENTIIALESMGTSVGDNGVQYFTANYFNSGYIVDCFTFDYDGNIPVPIEPPVSAWPSLGWFFSAWEALKQLFSGNVLIPS